MCQTARPYPFLHQASRKIFKDDVYGFPLSLDILFMPPSLTFSLYSLCAARRGFAILARDGDVETILTTAKRLVEYSSLILIPSVRKKGKMQNLFNPHQNDQGRKGPCYFQKRLIALKCLKCQKIKKNI